MSLVTLEGYSDYYDDYDNYDDFLGWGKKFKRAVKRVAAPVRRVAPKRIKKYAKPKYLKRAALPISKKMAKKALKKTKKLKAIKKDPAKYFKSAAKKQVKKAKKVTSKKIIKAAKKGQKFLDKSAEFANTPEGMMLLNAASLAMGYPGGGTMVAKGLAVASAAVHGDPAVLSQLMSMAAGQALANGGIPGMENLPLDAQMLAIENASPELQADFQNLYQSYQDTAISKATDKYMNLKTQGMNQFNQFQQSIQTPFNQIIPGLKSQGMNQFNQLKQSMSQYKPGLSFLKPGQSSFTKPSTQSYYKPGQGVISTQQSSKKPTTMTLKEIEEFNRIQSQSTGVQDMSYTDSAGDKYYKAGLLHGSDEQILKVLATKIFSQNTYSEVPLVSWSFVDNILRAYVYSVTKLSEEKNKSYYYDGTSESERQQVFGNLYIKICYLYLKGFTTEQQARQAIIDYTLRDQIWVVLALLKKFAAADKTGEFLKFWKPYEYKPVISQTNYKGSNMMPYMIAGAGALLFLVMKKR